MELLVDLLSALLGLLITGGKRRGSRELIDLALHWNEQGRPDSLRHANLVGADLRGGRLGRGEGGESGADLSRADLREANPAGANLTWAKVTKEQLAQAASLKGTTMPDGTVHR